MKSNLWEKTLLLQQRLAQEEEVLDCQDLLGSVNEVLDTNFNEILCYFSDLEGLIFQAFAKNVNVYYSEKIILIELPEPIEFKRVFPSYYDDSGSIEIMYVCNSSEKLILIFPASAENHFQDGGILTLR